tara:strand:- start:270 stop:503 length:234 start_codon:yes stop_codon:yes gene_type:complete
LATSKYKPFGVDLDPKGELKETNLPDGDISAEIRGEKVRYSKMIDELEERANNVAKGKRPATNRKYFSGWEPPNKRK